MSFTKPIRMIEYESFDPFFNLAAEEYFFRKTDCDYLRLWRNHNTIVIGKNQNPYNEVNLDTVRENNVTVSRRITGGGAVYHDMGNVNFTFIKSGARGIFDFKRFNEPVVKALARLGVVAEIQGRNDIVINGRKISGSAQFISEGRVLHHGTLLYKSDLNFIGRCLNVSGDKLQSKGVASVRSRVANISDFMNGSATVSVEEFIQVLKEFFLSEFESCETTALTQEDLAGITALRESKFATWEWIYGSSPEYAITAENRFDNCGNVGIYLDIKNGVIKDCHIRGDFFGNIDIAELEKQIKGCEAKYDGIRKALKEIDMGQYIHNLSKEDFLGMLRDL